MFLTYSIKNYFIIYYLKRKTPLFFRSAFIFYSFDMLSYKLSMLSLIFLSYEYIFSFFAIVLFLNSSLNFLSKPTKVFKSLKRASTYSNNVYGA
jgi:hypothetical protein